MSEAWMAPESTVHATAAVATAVMAVALKSARNTRVRVGMHSGRSTVHVWCTGVRVVGMVALRQR